MKAPLARRAGRRQSSKIDRSLARALSVLHGTPDLGNKPDPTDELVYIILARHTREGGHGPN